METFTRRVETDILGTKYKVYEIVVPRNLVYPMQESNVINLFNRSIQWLCSVNELYNVLLSLNYFTVVDSSFFLENPNIILAYLIFAIDHKILGRGGFVVQVEKDLQSVFVDKLCGSFRVLETVHHVWQDMRVQSKLYFRLVLDYTSAL